MWIDFYFSFLVVKTSFDKMEGPGVNIYESFERDLSGYEIQCQEKLTYIQAKLFSYLPGLRQGFKFNIFGRMPDSLGLLFILAKVLA